MFPLSKLLLCVAQDEQTKKETLKLVKPLLEQVFSHSSLINVPIVKNREV